MRIDDTGSVSLQDAFQKFRKKRKNQIKSVIHAKPFEEVKDSERVQHLRKVFVDQAMKYIGVPYAKRYHDEQSPDYHAPLFLDCCALVRRVLLDMKDQLGFRIGPWNQGYQFDTLPITISKEKDMKPGDLVFISGKYFQPKKKKQKHDMVHVEIWLGEGVKTIGARFQKGKIQVHDSYKFVSKSYHSMVYHFKSIDTWLKGVCRSFCSEHAWRSSKYINHGKHSIFAISDQSQSQSAGDDDNEDDGCNQESKDNNNDHSSRLESETKSKDIPGYVFDITSNGEGCTAMELEDISCDCLSVCDCMGECVCSCDECDALGLGETFSGISVGISQLLSSDHLAQCSDGMRSCSPDDKAKVGKTPTGQAKSQKNSSSSSPVRSPRKSRSLSPAKSPSKPLSSLASSSIKSHEISAPKFYIGGHNGVALVEKPLLDMGWERIEDNRDLSYHLKWVECKSQIDYKNFKEGEQIVNHIRNASCLTSKHGLMQTLQGYQRLTNRRFESSKIDISEFYPETYSIDKRQEIESFCSLYKAGETWICKPGCMNQGKGIFLVRSLDQLRRELSEREAKRTRRSTGRVISRYLTNPLLLNGFKFDIRAYMLIASTTPYMVFYHPGYVRLSCVPFSNDSTDITAHLTNQFIQRKHPDYIEKKGETVWTFEKFNQYVEENYKTEKGLTDNWVTGDLTNRIKEIMLVCFRAAQNKMEKRCGYFDLLGFDFMVDEDMKVWLIEINVNPALFTNCAALQEVIPGVVDETLKISIEAFENKRKRKRLSRLTSVKNFELLYDGERNVSFRRPKVSEPRVQSESVDDAEVSLSEMQISDANAGSETAALEKEAQNDKKLES